jgi:glycosyltransferase involved in cell wall biosynthesis
VLIFTQYYTPAKKAGGPITSISNLVTALNQDFSIVSRGQDLNEGENLEGIQVNTWTDSKRNYFVGIGFSSIRSYFKMLRSNSQEVFYINGIFDWKINLLPMIIGKKLIISPRGMLQQGALKNGSIKKGFYLAICRYQLKTKDVLWHATDEIEANDINLIFGRQKIKVIPNLVSLTDPQELQSSKKPSYIRFVYYSLISEKKNLIHFLELLLKWEGSFDLDIYGPDKDIAFAEKCKEFVASESNLKDRVRFHGVINSHEFPSIAEKYDYFVLPTLGENYGHAIVESLALGLPVLISDQTPWKLDSITNNYSISLDDQTSWLNVFNEIANLDASAHLQAKKAAQNFFQENIAIQQASNIEAYKDLFLESIPLSLIHISEPTRPCH